MSLSTLSKPQPRNSKMINEHAFKCFIKIAEFVSQLNEAFGYKFHEVTLYNHLLSKIKLSNKAAMTRNIELFGEFCSRNQDAIMTKDFKKMAFHRVAYSEKVYVDLYAILASPETDEATASVIWTHLLVIQATIEPSSEAQSVLRRLKENESSEGKFLDGFLSKIEGSIDKDKMGADPLSAASSILQSGVLNELVGSIDSGVKNGNLDLGKLVGTVQQMLGGLSGQMGGDASGGAPGGGLDLGAMMNMMSSMMPALAGGMGNMGGGPAAPGGSSSSSGGGLAGLDPEKVKAQIEAQVEAEKKKLEEEERQKEEKR